MKKIYLVLILFVSILPSIQAQLSYVSVDQFLHDGPVGSFDFTGYTTYRIFAHTVNTEDQVLIVLGSESEDGCPGYIRTTSSGWYNSPVSGDLGQNNIESVWSLFEGGRYDSFVTIGNASDSSIGIPYSENELGLIPEGNSNSTISLGSFLEGFGQQGGAEGVSGGNVELDTYNGSAWFALPNGANSFGVGVNNSVLLGQFTTDGIFSYALSVEAQVTALEDDIERYAWCDESSVQGLTYASQTNCNSELACNYEPGSTSDLSCLFIGDSCNDLDSSTGQDQISDDCSCEGTPQGCMDELACNYDENALLDDGSCAGPGNSCDDLDSSTGLDIYQMDCSCSGMLWGCTNSEACNYNSDAEIDDNTCEFLGESCDIDGYNGEWNTFCECSLALEGVVFIDSDFNGVFNAPDTPLPYQTVSIPELEIQVISDDNGRFIFSDLPIGDHELAISYTTGWTTFTTSVNQEVEFPQAEDDLVYFGVNLNEIPAPEACVDFYQFGSGVPCSDILNYNICYRNMSVYPISGTVEVVLDPLLSFNSSYPDGAVVDGQVVTWEFIDLASWTMNFDNLVVNTPDETHLGEWMTSSVTVYTTWEGELLALTSQTIEQEVTCAYDPNDITGIPEGYTDEHLVLENTSMEYLIRFQNTGNAPAETVLVVDTLDPGMDFSTFQLIANSHNVLTTIEPSGRVEFLFENIQLPDSTTNEPGSHGLVSFKIDFLDNIAIGEELNQTAHIYFDNNPPIVTNTTWHTIHECGGEASFIASAIDICAGETVEFQSEYDLIEDLQWNVNSVLENEEFNFSRVFDESGEYIIQLVAENPLCNASTMQLINVYETPTVEFTQNGDLLTASEGESYQWLLNGEEIDGANQQVYSVIEDGTYSVEITNGGVCSAESEGLMLVGVSEFEAETILLYPNPMSDRAYLEFEDSSTRTIRLIDAMGREVRIWENVSSEKIEIQRRDLSTGNYTLVISDKNNLARIKIIISQ